MSMEIPQPAAKASKPEQNPLQRRMADAKGNRELRNTFEALGKAGELQAKFDSALVKLEDMEGSKDQETKKWALEKTNSLTKRIDLIATETDPRQLQSHVEMAEWIIDEVNQKGTDNEYRAPRVVGTGNVRNAEQHLKNLRDEDTRAQGGPR